MSPQQKAKEEQNYNDAPCPDARDYALVDALDGQKRDEDEPVRLWKPPRERTRIVQGSACGELGYYDQM